MRFFLFWIGLVFRILRLLGERFVTGNREVSSSMFCYSSISEYSTCTTVHLDHNKWLIFVLSFLSSRSAYRLLTCVDQVFQG